MRIFVSFASKDRETVRRFEAALRGRRPEMSCFLDERGLTGGIYWIPKLGEELAKADVVLLLLGTSIGPWQELEYYEALQLSRQSGRGGRPRIIPVVVVDQPAPGLAFLSTLHQIFALDLTSAPALLAIENALSAIPATEVVEPWRRFQPYTGLPALTERDAAFFFGRDKETAEVLDLLARARGRIVTLIGQSGVGKSSLIMAGVLSRLKSQLWPIEGAAWPAGLKDSRSYLQLTMRPGPDPLKELAVGLVKLYRSKDESWEIEKEASDWTARFREGSRLRDMLRLTRDRIAEQQGGYPPKRFVLYVDQGEELYTRAPKDEARLFSRLLADAAGEAFSVLLSLRSDFYTDFQNDGAIFDLSEKFDLLPLARDVLIDVIRRPAEVLGARFEDATLPRLIAEATQREPGALPLLSDLLQEMWLNMLSRGDGVLRWSDQPGIVDIGLPLKRRADAFLELPTTDPDVVRRLFTLRLAQVAQVGEPVRRRARKSECTPAEWSVVEQLAGSDQRLLTISDPLLGGEPIVEVAHEQLLQSWPTLKKWLAEQREFLIWRTETEQAAADYRKLPVEKSPEAVLMGLRLTSAESWFAQRADDLAPELRDYVKVSIARRDELLDRQQREGAQKLETEHRLKETERERERLARTAAEEKAAAARDKEVAALKLFRISFAAAIVLMVVAGLAIFGFLSARRATLVAVANESRALSALSRTAIDNGSGTDAAELALAAWPRNTSDSRPELEAALRMLGASTALGLEVVPRMAHDGPVYGALFSRDGDRILSWSRDKTLRLWDAATGAPIGPAMKHDGWVRGALFSRDESRILSWSGDKTLRLWDRATGAEVSPAMKHDGWVRGALFSRDESRILSWSGDKTLRLWDRATGAQISPAMRHDESVSGALLSRDERRVLSWSADATLRLWDAATGAQIGPAMKHDDSVSGAVYSQDEGRILSWSTDETLRLWDTATGAQIGPAMRHDASVSGAVYSRDDRRILSWSTDRTLRLWDAATGAQIGPAMKHDSSVNGAVYSRDEGRILSWSGDGTLRLWDTATGAQIGPPMEHDASVSGALFSRDDRRILSWSTDRTLRLWDTATGAQIGSAMKHDASVSGALLSRDGGRILSWSGDGTLRLWDTATGAQIGPAMRHDASVNGALFSRDDRRILSWSTDRTLRLWDAATGAQIGPAMKHDDSVSGALLSRDDRRILSWSTDRTLRLWDAATGAQIGPAMEHDGWVSGALFSRDDRRILSWSGDGTLRLWDAATGAQIGPPMKHDDSVSGALLSRDDRRILSWSTDRTLRQWDAATGAQIGPAMEHDGWVNGALLSRDEGRILSWSGDGTLRLWDAATGSQIGPPREHDAWVSGALFSRDDRGILSWSTDRTVRQWDAATGAQIGPAMKHDDSVSGALFSRDEGRILSWSRDGTLRLWDAATGAQTGPAMKHDASINGVLFSRDDRRILSWSTDRTLRLWDTATGTQIGPAMRHDDASVSGTMFSRDDRRILSWSTDRTLRLWNAAWRGGNLFEIACNHLPQTHDLARLSSRYGLRISDPICEVRSRIPVPDWKTVERALQ